MISDLITKSLDIKEIELRANNIITQGYREIVLTGIHLGLFRGVKGGLEEAIAVLASMKQLERIRLGSVEPSDFDEELMHAFKEFPQLCSHLHIPLQSGSDRVLQAMRRPYSADEYCNLLASLRAVRSNFAFSTDIIAGFPGEEEADHQQSMDVLRQCRMARIHVFPYSRRPNTEAAAMGNQVSSDIRRRRAQELIALGQHLKVKNFELLIGTRLKVLLEFCGRDATGEYFFGHADDYTEVRVYNSAMLSAGEVAEAVVKKVCSSYVEASLI